MLTYGIPVVSGIGWSQVGPVLEGVSVAVRSSARPLAVGKLAYAALQAGLLWLWAVGRGRGAVRSCTRRSEPFPTPQKPTSTTAPGPALDGTLVGQGGPSGGATDPSLAQGIR